MRKQMSRRRRTMVPRRWYVSPWGSRRRRMRMRRGMMMRRRMRRMRMKVDEEEEEEEEEAYARGLTPRTCVGREPRRPSSIGKTC